MLTSPSAPLDCCLNVCIWLNLGHSSSVSGERPVPDHQVRVHSGLGAHHVGPRHVRHDLVPQPHVAPLLALPRLAPLRAGGSLVGRSQVLDCVLVSSAGSIIPSKVPPLETLVHAPETDNLTPFFLFVSS